MIRRSIRFLKVSGSVQGGMQAPPDRESRCLLEVVPSGFYKLELEKRQIRVQDVKTPRKNSDPVQHFKLRILYFSSKVVSVWIEAPNYRRFRFMKTYRNVGSALFKSLKFDRDAHYPIFRLSKRKKYLLQFH
jgi:hypothetical protein